MSRFGLHVIVLTALTLISSCLRTGAAQEVIELKNELCNPRSTIIPIDQPSYRHFPYYVTLYRCGGSDGYTSPRYRTCVPATTKDVRIKVRNLDTSEFAEIIEKNHTSCKSACANNKAMCDAEMEAWNEQACRCECRYPDGPPQACPARFKWNRYMCACECNKEEHASQCLAEGKVWSHDKCGCECSPRVITRCKKLNMVLNEQTCRCVLGEVVFGAKTGTGQEKGISKTMLVGIVFGELLLLLFIFDLILYMTKKWGFMYYIKKSVGKAVSKDSHESPPLSPTANHDKSTGNHDTSTYV
ncbi:Hypothetical predicted protein [Paramuricea clavata]|uniref:Uncharacterized protein n=1 Tax=Paramuricea clavata TaxID=317549 RepID=A0A7D9HKG5_PARCT|nr:Hypothetical predicted protein [Paramuricea clavata]